VGVQVYDSDICALCLFDRGHLVDRYSSNPGYWLEGEPTEDEKLKAVGNPERWANLLAAGRTAAELAACWAEERTFAEDTVLKTAELLGCSPDYMTVGYEYLMEEPLGDGARVLRFRMRSRPAWEVPAAGPPKLVAHVGILPTARFAVGDELTLQLMCRNAGGEGKGLWALAWGDALSSGLVEVEKFVVVVGDVTKSPEPLVLHPLPRQSAENPVLQADIPEQRIPAGVSTSMDSIVGDPLKVIDAMHRSLFCLNVVGRVVKTGEGELGIGLSPMDNPREGSLGFAHKLVTDPQLYRPLHAPATVSSQILRSLADDTFLIGMIVLDACRSQLVDLAREAFEQFAIKCPATGNYHVTIHCKDRERQPRSQAARIEGFFADAKWKELQRAMCDEQQVCVETEKKMPDFSTTFGKLPNLHAGGHGLMVGGAILGPGTPDDPELPVACWWADVSKWSAAQVVDIAAVLETRIDATMQSGEGVQAFIARYGNAPDRLDSTAYEEACQISGAPTTLKSWSTRWLRAMGTEALWIGPSLRSRLKSGVEAILMPHSDVFELGRALKIRPHSRNAIPALEQAMAGIIPTPIAHLEASNTYYARLRETR
jgi:hypothetical protein